MHQESHDILNASNNKYVDSLTAQDDDAIGHSATTLYPPSTKIKTQMVAYWISKKAIPYPAPSPITDLPVIESGQLLELIPVEKECQVCSSALEGPCLITDRAEIVTMQGVIATGF